MRGGVLGELFDKLDHDLDGMDISDMRLEGGAQRHSREHDLDHFKNSYRMQGVADALPGTTETLGSSMQAAR